MSFARMGARGEPSPKKSLRWVHKYGLLKREDEGQDELIVEREVEEQWIGRLGTKVPPAHSPTLANIRNQTRAEARKKAQAEAHDAALTTLAKAGKSLEDLSSEERELFEEWVKTTAEFYKPWEEQELDPISQHLALNQAPITLEDFRAEVRNAYSTLTLYDSLRKRDNAQLRSRIRDAHEKEPRYPLSEVDKWLRYRISESMLESEQESTNVRWYASWGLERFVKERVAKVQLAFSEIEPRPGYAPAYAPVQSWNCPDLLSAIYLQFYIWMTGAWPMRYCENRRCGLPFPATRTDKRYCTDTCRSAARNHR
jgi:hypothetical protein